jgi:hypothetical protein
MERRRTAKDRKMRKAQIETGLSNSQRQFIIPRDASENSVSIQVCASCDPSPSSAAAASPTQAAAAQRL